MLSTFVTASHSNLSKQSSDVRHRSPASPSSPRKTAPTPIPAHRKSGKSTVLSNPCSGQSTPSSSALSTERLGSSYFPLLLPGNDRWSMNGSVLNHKPSVRPSSASRKRRHRDHVTSSSSSSSPSTACKAARILHTQLFTDVGAAGEDNPSSEGALNLCKSSTRLQPVASSSSSQLPVVAAAEEASVAEDLSMKVGLVLYSC